MKHPTAIAPPPIRSGASHVAGRPIKVGPLSSITTGTPVEQHIV
jgi:hypothetical protein